MWWGGFSECTVTWFSWFFVGLNPHVVGRFFRGLCAWQFRLRICVLIPMWWGGFSEFTNLNIGVEKQSLNPHVVGRFFREDCSKDCTQSEFGLNPHVVGRFFRVNSEI